ncbi:MAG: hypothetical protein U9N73_11765, partial [Candidatus Auribacterota bacterium]|nr:hypothetical protein [Candidatus Auribacterota bacterium]
KLFVDEDGNMTGRIAIKGDFYRFIRDDSQVIIKKKFLLAGDSYIDISKGQGAMLPEDSELTCKKDTEITEFLEIEIENFIEAILPAVEQAEEAVEEYTKLAAGINDPEGELQQLLANLRIVSDGLARGEGMAGGVLRDPAMLEDLKEIIARLNELTVQFKQMAEDGAGAVATLPSMAEDISGEIKDARGIILQSRHALQETQRLIDALQKHWLISGYVDKEEETPRIPSSAVTISE